MSAQGTWLDAQGTGRRAVGRVCCLSPIVYVLLYVCCSSHSSSQESLCWSVQKLARQAAQAGAQEPRLPPYIPPLVCSLAPDLGLKVLIVSTIPVSPFF
jgi:hypothetical protein